jgi:hypothetical protein
MKIFETKADLVAASLTAGQLVATKGYYAAGDGGAADYIVAATQAVDGYGDHALAGGTVALLQHSGTLEGLKYGLPLNNTTSDSAPALQAMIDTAQESGFWVQLPSEGRLRLDSPITFKQGRSATDAFAYEVLFDGNHCTVLQNHAGNCFEVVARCLYADKATGRNSGKVVIKNTIFDGYFVTLNSYTSARALVIGQGGLSMSSFEVSVISDITVTGYLTVPLDFTSCRHFAVNRVVTRSPSGGVRLSQRQEGFVGDMTFNGCEFSGTETDRPIELYSFSASGNAECRGNHFTDCVIYGSGTKIHASTNGQTADTWFTSCAFDGPDAPVGEDAIEILASSTGKVIQTSFVSPYIVNYTGKALAVESQGASFVQAIQLSNPRISFIQHATSCIQIISAEQFSLRGGEFFNNTSSETVNISADCQHVVIQNNSSQSTNTNFITIGGTGTDDFIITGNCSTSTNTVNDYSTAVTKLVANNLTMTA